MVAHIGRPGTGSMHGLVNLCTGLIYLPPRPGAPECSTCHDSDRRTWEGGLT